jgi:hypothetical protein
MALHNIFPIQEKCTSKLLKNIMQYIKGTLNYGIKYQIFENGQILCGYFDIDLGRDKDSQCFTSGYYLYLLKKQ